MRPDENVFSIPFIHKPKSFLKQYKYFLEGMFGNTFPIVMDEILECYKNI